MIWWGDSADIWEPNVGIAPREGKTGGQVIRIALPLIVALLATGAALADPVKLTYVELPPYSYTQDGMTQGTMIVMASRLVSGLDISLEPQFVPLRRINFEADRKPFIVVAIVRTAEREQRFQWIGPLCTDPFVMATVAPRAAMDTLEEARKARSIAVAAGASNESYLRNLGFTNIDPAADIGLEARRLAEGHDDAWFGPRSGILLAWKGAGYNPAMLRFGAPIEPMTVWMAASQAVPAELVTTLRGRFADAAEAGRIAEATGCRD